MKTLLVAALLVVSATAAFAVQVDPQANEACAGRKDAQMCGFKLSACLDDAYSQLGLTSGEYPASVWARCRKEVHLPKKSGA